MFYLTVILSVVRLSGVYTGLSLPKALKKNKNNKKKQNQKSQLGEKLRLDVTAAGLRVFIDKSECVYGFRRVCVCVFKGVTSI